MRRLSVALIAAASIIVTQIASAADLPRKATAYTPPPVYNWTGFYVGGNAGYGWGHAHSDTTATISSIGLGLNTGNNVITSSAASVSTQLNGALGGAQAGYNWQSGSWVYGLEADVQVTGQRGDDVFASTALLGAVINNVVATGTLSNTTTYKLPWFGTFRGRIGYAADRWLLYTTGGLAFGEISTASTTTMGFTAGVGVPPPAQSFSSREVRAGWVIGAGVETAFATNWSFKLEYLHMNLGSIDQPFSTPAVATVFATISATGNLHARLSDDIVRIGVNYKFGGPVVATY
jgi:outer membrane immunogenic protein